MGARKDKNGFTPLQKLFAHEYLIDLNAEAAAIRSGYSEKSAYSIASELMKLPHIQEAIQKGMDRRAAKIDINAETILRELLKIATVDIAEAYDENGRLLPIKEIPQEIRKSISAIKIFEEFEGLGKDRIQVGVVREVKFWDKIRSLELLGKHLKLFIDKVEHSGGLDLRNMSDQELLNIVKDYAEESK